MIYIDPPYNTGNDFVYHDKFGDTIANYKEQAGLSSQSNPETSGRYHSDWCSMMYPRLKLARELLAADGVIFISIDSHEFEHLKCICNEVFSETNYCGTLVLQTATDNNPTQVNEEHEYMLCYSRDKKNAIPWYRMIEGANYIQTRYGEIKSKENDINEIQKALRKWINENKGILGGVTHYNCVDEKGVYSASSNSSNPHPGDYNYDIFHPVTHLPCPKPRNGWRWPEESFLAMERKGEVHWGADHSTQPHLKKRLNTAMEQLKSVIYEDNRSETNMLNGLFDSKKVFENPKPH